MSTNLDVFMANVRKAVLDCETTTVGGGVFSPGELHQVSAEIAELKRRVRNAESESDELLVLSQRLKNNQTLLLAAVVRVLNSRYTVLSPDDRLALNTAYRHVTGT